jgi:hypothetical protein
MRNSEQCYAEFGGMVHHHPFNLCWDQRCGLVQNGILTTFDQLIAADGVCYITLGL